MRQLISLLTSAGTIWGMWLAGNKNPLGWMVGLFNQILWLLFIVLFEAYGLLPLSAFLTVVYTRNLIRWKAEEAEAEVDAIEAAREAGEPA